MLSQKDIKIDTLQRHMLRLMSGPNFLQHLVAVPMLC